MTEKRIVEALQQLIARGVGPDGNPRGFAVDAEGHLAGLPGLTSVMVRIPGIGTGAPYASGDAFGGRFSFAVPVDGTIANVMFYDYDDEGIQKDLMLFAEEFTETTDNSEFDPSAGDLSNSIGPVLITSFTDFANNQMGKATPALSYHAPHGRLWAQIVTRGADNIAAGAIPEIRLVII